MAHVKNIFFFFVWREHLCLSVYSQKCSRSQNSQITLIDMFDRIWFFSSVQWLSNILLFATPWTAAHQASLSITNSWSLLKLMSIKSMIPSNHLMLSHPLLLLPSIFPSIRSLPIVCIRWPKYWSFSFSTSPSNECSGLISFRMDWLDLLVAQRTLKSLLQTTVQKHQFFGVQLSL